MYVEPEEVLTLGSLTSQDLDVLAEAGMVTKGKGVLNSSGAQLGTDRSPRVLGSHGAYQDLGYDVCLVRRLGIYGLYPYALKSLTQASKRIAQQSMLVENLVHDTFGYHPFLHRLALKSPLAAD
jgi:hypothetical protein